MIYTCTFNPSLDYYLEFGHDINLKSVNRSNLEYFVAGGKGIHVSIILNNLMIRSTAFGFIGGFDSTFYINLLQRYSYLQPAFAHIQGHTRINVKLNDGTELNARGPIVDYQAQNDFLRKIERVSEDDYFIISGNIQDELLDFSVEVAEKLINKGVNVVVDTNEEIMARIIELKPFLVKYDIETLNKKFNKELSFDEALSFAKETQKKAKNVIISFNPKDSILVCDEGVFKASIFDEVIEQTVARGDTMIAGFVFNKQRGFSDKEAYRYGACCGLATTFATTIEMRQKIDRYYDHFEVEKID